MSGRRTDLSKYIESPESKVISVATRYSYHDIRNSSSIDYESMVKHEAAMMLIKQLIEEDLVEFKTANISNPMENVIEVKASIRVQSRYLKFKLEGLI
jgi:hypothetical protein